MQDRSDHKPLKDTNMQPQPNEIHNQQLPEAGQLRHTDDNGIPIHAVAGWQASASEAEKQAIAVLRELGGCTAHSVTTHAAQNDEAFTLSPGVEREKRDSVETLPRPSDRKGEVLQTMSDLGAPTRLGNVRQVAEMCGCSERSVHRQAEFGNMPFGVKIGALRRWDLDEIDKWIRDGCKPVSDEPK